MKHQDTQTPLERYKQVSKRISFLFESERYFGFKKALQNKVFIGAILFIVLLYFFEEIRFDYPQMAFFQMIFVFGPFDEKLIAVSSGITSAVFCFWFAWISLSISRRLQIIPLFLFTISSFIQYGFWKAVERFISSIDLQIASGTSLESWKGAGTLYFNWEFILPVFGFITILFFFSNKKSQAVTFKQSVGLFLYLILLCYSHTFTNKPHSFGPSISSFYQTIIQFVFEDLFTPKRSSLDFQESTQPSNNIVLIIDESIRGDHLSINGYDRDTTPFLEQLTQESDLIRNWGLAVAGATCSYPSNALILTGVQPNIDEFEMTSKYPSLFQYARAMGYETYYIDAQTNSIWNGLSADDFKYIDVWVKAVELGDDIQSDFRAADFIVNKLSEDVGKFIVLNKRGVHFLYEKSYPATSKIWSPIPSDYYNQPELVTNPYDNGIRYNVNTFFERLLASRSILENTVILYTSDHGQTLFEDNTTWLHCNYTPAEAIVPLLMIGKNIPGAASENFPASHSNILPTLLDLMGVPLEQKIYSYAPSLFSASLDMKIKRFFLDGRLSLVEFQFP